MLTKRFLVLAAAVALASCSLDKQAAPALAGPSELSLSLQMSATPDILTQDGKSQSTIQVFARDAMGQPVSGLTLRADTSVGGTLQDFGVLSAKTLSTGTDGKATITYRSPAAPPPTADSDTTVAVSVTPVGTDFGANLARSVFIQLLRPGVILPPSTKPVPEFFFSPTTPNESDIVSFDASPTQAGTNSTITSYVWNFGDGNTASGLRITHTYALRGNYPVLLTVTDNLGASVSVQHTVSVGATANPTALFTYSPTQPIVGQTVNFNGTGSQASPGRAIDSYEWDFGDGSPHGSGTTSQHVYSIPATYTVTLRVTDSSGHQGVASNTVAVTTAKPTADFTISPPSPNAGSPVQFNGTLSAAPAGKTIVLYQWDFGDGAHASGATTTHIYPLPVDTFTVVLTVTDDSGATGVTSKTVTTK